MADGELALTNLDTNAKKYRVTSALNNGKKIHPTQKPVALYKWLLKNYAKEGDKILDTHLGSASSIVACIDMGFDFMGFELDEDYYNAAKKRVTNHLNQGDLTRDLKFSTVVL
jgi:site-specific DNA-methyltransferase (adenine-specific)